MNLKSLIQKLNPTCQQALESAAGACLSASNYNVEIEHWLLKLLETPQTDIHVIFSYYGVYTDRVLAALTKALRSLKTGNVQAPALSQRLIDLVQEALLMAHLEYGASQIRSVFLLDALITGARGNKFFTNFLEELDVIPFTELRENYTTLLVDSVENTSLIKPTFSSNTLPASKTPALDQYTINLTELAQAGKIDAVIGRDEEISQIIDILMRRRQNNPILTGEPGVGKTAVVEGFALRIAQKQVPPALQNVVVRTLDLALLQAGAGIKGEFENRLKSVIQEVKSSPYPIILFIDEAHTLVGAGGQAGQGDAANMLKPALARGELRTIAATTWTEYKKYFEQDAALTRRFQVVKIDEPDEETAISMLRGLVSPLETHHGVHILDEAIIAAVQLSHRYITHRQLPDKAISALDTACANLAIRKSMSVFSVEEAVDAQSIAKIVSNWTGIPLGRMLSNEVDRILQLEKSMQIRIMGQPHALKIISQSIHTARAQLADPQKPVGVFLFVGPSGVGKTETAITLAETLYGGTQNMTVINLSEFKEEHKVSMLLGSPPGYVGYGEGGVLTEAVRRRPYSLVLLDEVEKAHVGIQDIFYQVFDKGMLKDGQGRDIDFKNTVIILTSNVASELIMRLSGDDLDLESLKEAIRPELLRFFKPAFLARVTLVPYLPLSDLQMQAIVELQLQRIQARVMNHYQAVLSYEQSVVQYIVDRCQEVQTGARNIDHILTGSLLPELSAHFLTATAENRKIPQLHIDINEQGFVYT